MFIVNTDYIEGKKLEMLGLVKGSTVQSKHIGKDIGASFKSIIGGELRSYTEMMEEARQTATESCGSYCLRHGCKVHRAVNRSAQYVIDRGTLYRIRRRSGGNQPEQTVCLKGLSGDSVNVKRAPSGLFTL